jgi:hypothetical protein
METYLEKDGLTMTTNSHAVTISIVMTSEERKEALSYIKSSMQRAFGCDPPPTRGLICVAREGSTIVGSLVLQNALHNCTFPIEEHYVFDARKAPFPFVREEIFQASRWLADTPGVSLLVVQACAQLARDLGKLYFFIEAKPYSAKRLQELGFNCQPIPGAVLLPELARIVVGDAGMRFYEEDPQPTLYMLPM